MNCIHVPTRRILAQHVEKADTFLTRLWGLMGRKELVDQAALLLDPCPQIHTCFMRFNIDVLFLDGQDRVVAVVENMKPWRMSKFYALARRTLELPGGSLRGLVQVGDELLFNE